MEFQNKGVAKRRAQLAEKSQIKLLISNVIASQ